MDIMAYMMTGLYREIATANGIDVPRLRGCRWMKEEAPYTEDDIKFGIRACEEFVYRDMICSTPRFTESHTVEFSAWTDYLQSYYLEKRKNEETGQEEIVRFRWERLHGKARRRLKFALKKARKASREYMETFNRYAGREDVLCIHARIGGWNWNYYDHESHLDEQPWFLEKRDDPFDCTYCNIFAKVTVPDGFEDRLRGNGKTNENTKGEK